MGRMERMEPKRVGPDGLREIDGPPEIRRREAFSGTGMWAGTATTQPGMVSGWHHHDGNHTVIYVLSGRLRIDFAEGLPSVDGGPGDFLLVPSGLVHRESTPEEPAETVVVRFGGDGPPTVEVDPPS